MGETQEESIERQAQWARSVLPLLLEYSDRVDRVIEEAFARVPPFEYDDAPAVMTVAFCTKQREHLRSIRVLLAAGQDRDAQLVARAMIEGMARLLWATKDWPNRAEQWLWFGLVLDKRRADRLESRGIAVDGDAKAGMAERLKEHGEQFFTKAVREQRELAESRGEAFELPDDPWGKRWTDSSAAEAFRESGGAHMYEAGYAHASDWIHWSPQAVLAAFETGTWAVGSFTKEDARAAVEALQLGCQAVLQCLEVLNSQFRLGTEGNLQSLFAEMEELPDKVAAGAE